MSLIGIFLFMVLLPDGAGSSNIPLGFVINWLGLNLNSFEINGFGLVFIIANVLITISLIGTIITYVFKPAFIMEKEWLKNLFLSHPVYFVSKVIAVIIAWMVFFRTHLLAFTASFGDRFGRYVYVESEYGELVQEVVVGLPWSALQWVIEAIVGWGGGRLMMDLIAGGSSGSNLITIFLVLGLAIPLLTDFGLMEFLGMLIRKVVRFLFTLPGRSSIDLLGSWFSSSAAGVIITREQHEKGFYTGREAAAICVNFTFVSLPFTFVIADTVGLVPHFWLFYLVICITVIILAVVMPRIWPLRGLRDEYLPEVGKQIEEEPPANVSLFSQATKLAGFRASQSTPVGVIKSGLSNWLNIFMDLIPVILAWGTIALIIESHTPVFNRLAMPFGWYMHFLGVEYALEYASASIVGFIDMFIPALLLGDFQYVAGAGDYIAGYGYGYGRVFDVPAQTRFILGALSIVQIIYLAETGILILKSKIPLHIGHLAIIFVMRTVFALPIIVLLTRLLFRY